MTKAKLAVLLGIISFAGLFFYFKNHTPSSYDSLAQCLTQKGAKMYGAYWCPHCKEQKKMFGSSFKYINYIECASPGSNIQKAECKKAGIKGYPTWEFNDGSRLTGKLDFDTLAQKTGCSLP
ncbi:MAG: hypothetical protein GXP43_03285 [bacterium]|nr:hypothetical protein [bacterium]